MRKQNDSVCTVCCPNSFVDCQSPNTQVPMYILKCKGIHLSKNNIIIYQRTIRVHSLKHNMNIPLSEYHTLSSGEYLDCRKTPPPDLSRERSTSPQPWLRYKEHNTSGGGHPLREGEVRMKIDSPPLVAFLAVRTLPPPSRGRLVGA